MSNNNNQELSFYISPKQLTDFEAKRLSMIGSGVLACAIVGSAYAISVIMHVLQDAFDIDQNSLTVVSSIGFCAQFFTLPSGIGVDILGPRSVLCFATIVTALGWALFALTFNGNISHSTAALCVYDMLLVGTTGYTDPCVNLNNLFVFSLNRGLVVLVQKTFMGLSVSLLSVTYISLFQAENNNNDIVMENATSSSSGSENQQQYHDETGIISYCAMFSVVILIWGFVSMYFLKTIAEEKHNN